MMKRFITVFVLLLCMCAVFYGCDHDGDGGGTTSIAESSTEASLTPSDEESAPTEESMTESLQGAPSESEPEPSESEPEPSESEPESTESEPESSESEPESTESEPESSESETESLESEPEPTESEPESSESEPESTESEPESTESDPESSESEPASSETDTGIGEPEIELPGGVQGDIAQLWLYSLSELEALQATGWLPENFVAYEGISQIGEFCEIDFPNVHCYDISQCEEDSDFSEYRYHLTDAGDHSVTLSINQKLPPSYDFDIPSEYVNLSDMRSLTEEYSGTYLLDGIVYRYQLGKLRNMEWMHGGIEYRLSTEFSRYRMECESAFCAKMLSGSTAFATLEALFPGYAKEYTGAAPKEYERITSVDVLEELLASGRLPEEFVPYEKIVGLGEFNGIRFMSRYGWDNSISVYYLTDESGFSFELQIESIDFKSSDGYAPIPYENINLSDMRKSASVHGKYVLDGIVYRYVSGELYSIAWEHEGMKYTLSGKFVDYPTESSAFLSKMLNAASASFAMEAFFPGYFRGEAASPKEEEPPVEYETEISEEISSEPI